MFEIINKICYVMYLVTRIFVFDEISPSYPLESIFHEYMYVEVKIHRF